MIHADELHTGARQVCGGGDHISILGVYHRLLGGGLADKHLIAGVLCLALIHAQSGGGIGLGIKIADQHPKPSLRQCSCQIDSGGGFPHAAFLIHHCYDDTHFLSPFCPCILFHVKQHIFLFCAFHGEHAPAQLLESGPVVGTVGSSVGLVTAE